MSDSRQVRRSDMSICWTTAGLSSSRGDVPDFRTKFRTQVTRSKRGIVPIVYHVQRFRKSYAPTPSLRGSVPVVHRLFCFSSVDSLFGHIAHVSSGSQPSPTLSTQPLFQIVSWPRPPIPPLADLCGTCGFTCGTPCPLFPPRIRRLLSSSTCLDTSDDPCPFACSRWASPQRHVSFHCWSRVARQGRHF